MFVNVKNIVHRVSYYVILRHMSYYVIRNPWNPRNPGIGGIRRVHTILHASRVRHRGQRASSSRRSAAIAPTHHSLESEGGPRACFPTARLRALPEAVGAPETARRTHTAIGPQERTANGLKVGVARKLGTATRRRCSAGKGNIALSCGEAGRGARRCQTSPS